MADSVSGYEIFGICAVDFKTKTIVPTEGERSRKYFNSDSQIPPFAIWGSYWALNSI